MIISSYSLKVFGKSLDCICYPDEPHTNENKQRGEAGLVQLSVNNAVPGKQKEEMLKMDELVLYSVELIISDFT